MHNLHFKQKKIESKEVFQDNRETFPNVQRLHYLKKLNLLHMDVEFICSVP